MLEHLDDLDDAGRAARRQYRRRLASQFIDITGMNRRSLGDLSPEEGMDRSRRRSRSRSQSSSTKPVDTDSSEDGMDPYQGKAKAKAEGDAANNDKPIDVLAVARPQPSSKVSSTESTNAKPSSRPQGKRVEIKNMPKTWLDPFVNGPKVQAMAKEFGSLEKGYPLSYNQVDRISHVTFVEPSAAAAMVEAWNGRDNRSEKEKRAGGPPRARDVFALCVVV